MIRTAYIAALAFAAGAVGGTAVTYRLMSGAAARAELQDVRAADTAARTERGRQRVVAQQFEASRDLIDKDHKEAADALQPYLEARPDLRAIDLGPEWLCLVAVADGRACGPAPGGADRAVPGAADARPDAGPDAAGVPGHAPAVPAVRSATGSAERSHKPASNE